MSEHYKFILWFVTPDTQPDCLPARVVIVTRLTERPNGEEQETLKGILRQDFPQAPDASIGFQKIRSKCLAFPNNWALVWDAPEGLPFTHYEGWEFLRISSRSREQLLRTDKFSLFQLGKPAGAH